MGYLLVAVLMTAAGPQTFMEHHATKAKCETARGAAVGTLHKDLPAGFQYVISCLPVQKTGPAV